MKLALRSSLPPIIIDTREQLPYAFEDYPTIRKGLKYGDYSLEGYEDSVAIERKSKEDAYQCVGTGRKRFERHLAGLGHTLRPLLVIECGLEEFVRPPSHTRLTAAQAVGSYISWSVRFGIPVMWLEGRSFAQRAVLRWLVAFWKHRVNGGAVAC